MRLEQGCPEPVLQVCNPAGRSLYRAGTLSLWIPLGAVSDRYHRKPSWTRLSRTGFVQPPGLKGHSQDFSGLILVLTTSHLAVTLYIISYK